MPAGGPAVFVLSWAVVKGLISDYSQTQQLDESNQVSYTQFSNNNSVYFLHIFHTQSRLHFVPTPKYLFHSRHVKHTRTCQSVVIAAQSRRACIIYKIKCI